MVRSTSNADAAVTTEARGNPLERIASALTRSPAVSTVFGDPIEREGTTVIPVAKARWGFGGGGGPVQGAEQSSTNVGYGGGGGMLASPMGYIVLRNGTAEFRPIPNPLQMALLFAAGALAGLLLARRSG